MSPWSTDGSLTPPLLSDLLSELEIRTDVPRMPASPSFVTSGCGIVPAATWPDASAMDEPVSSRCHTPR